MIAAPPGFVRLFTVRVNDNINIWEGGVVTRLHRGVQTRLTPTGAFEPVDPPPVLASAVRMRRLIACAEADNNAIALHLLSPVALAGVLYVHSIEVFVADGAGMPRQQLFALFHALAGLDTSEFYTHHEPSPPAVRERVKLPSSGWSDTLRLFPQQVETLRWMQHVERNGVEVHLPPPVRLDGNALLVFDGVHGMRLVDRAPPPLAIRPRGCVLHNAVGTGKTAVVIALAMTSAARARACPWMGGMAAAHSQRRATGATLVCVPTNLVGQWKAEIAKFCPSAKVVTVVDIRHQRKLTSEAIRGADFVVTTYAFLRGKSYDTAIVKAVQDMGYGRTPSSSRFINPDVLSLFFAENAEALDERGHVFLETWHFNRIVLDELHEIRTMTQGQRSLLAYRLLTISTGAVWGVTATKPQSGSECNQVLNILAPGWERVSGAIHNQFLVEALYQDFGGEHPVAYTSTAWLVRPTATERAVIASMPSEERQVMACANLRGCVAQSDDDIVVGTQTEILERVLRDNVQELARREATLATQQRVRDVLHQEQETVASTHHDGQGYVDRALLRLDRRLDGMRQHVQALQRRSEFLRTVVDVGQECPICMEASADSMLSCGHLYCAQCVGRLHRRCAVCREQSGGLYRIGDSRSAPEGCKLACILGMLTDLRQKGESCVVFVQWAPVLAAAHTYLQSQRLDLDLFKLTGNVHARQATLRRFDESESAVLLLSLDCSSSGLNLVKANNVIFMHALTQPDAIAIEHQAIARVARIGQTRDVHVHHIIAEDTAEEQVFKRVDRSLAYGRFIEGEFRREEQD